MFRQYLLSAKTSGNPISIYFDDEDAEKFSFGFVQDVSEEHILLACVSPFGFYDGYDIIGYQSIRRLEMNDSYGERVHKLYTIRGENHPPVPFASGSLILDLIQFSCDRRLVITVELDHSGYDDLQGMISAVRDDAVLVNQLDDDGCPDGETVVPLDRITRVTCDSDREMAIKLLYEQRKGEDHEDLC